MVGKVWWLNMSYCETTDEFFAYVDDGTQQGVTIYQIDDTHEMCAFIKTGVMNHIDDAEGLTKFLIRQEFIAEGDMIKVNPELLW
jgi:hypothetical protein